MPKRSSLIIIAIMVVCAGRVVAVPKLGHPLDRGGFGAKIGVFNSTTFHFDSENNKLPDDEFIWKAGFSGGLFFDFGLGRGHLWSLAIELHDVQMMDDREKLFDVNLGYKVTFYNKNGRVALRPGFTAGYGYISHVGLVEGINVMTSKLFLEMVFLSDPRYSYMLEFGIGMLPTGKSGDYDVRSNPYLSVRGGIII